MIELTREGNEVLPANCAMRNCIMGNSDTLCGRCKHVLDGCYSIAKETGIQNGYQQVISCVGYEQPNMRKE